MATEKRARKKQHRDERRAAYQAALRRRRIIRLTVVFVILAVVIGLAFTLPGSDKTKASKKPKPAATPSPSASAEAPTKGPVACGAKRPPKAHPKQYKSAPSDNLEPGTDYSAVIHTSCGNIKMDLLEDDAPVTVNNFVFLAKQGFYDGLTWHRIVQNFVIQAGDPDGINGHEPDGPGYSIKDELPDKPNVYTFGAVAMANAGPNTGGSQFFVVVHTGPKGQKDVPAGLQPSYSLFGQVDKSSFGVIDKISKIPTQGGNDPSTADLPKQTVYIESIDIIEK